MRETPKSRLIHNVFDAIMNEGLEDTIPETFLEVIGKETREVYLSKLIAFSLAHDYILIEKLIRRYASHFKKGKKTDEIEINNPEIYIEQYMDGRRADIFVIIRTGKIVKYTLTIENKTDTLEHGSQTKDYKTWVNDNYRKSTNCFFFLYPDKSKQKAEDDDFENIAYSEFNELVSDSDNYIIQDLKNHITKYLQEDSMAFKNYEIEVVNHYNEFNSVLDSVNSKINAKKTNLLKTVEKKLADKLNVEEIKAWEDSQEINDQELYLKEQEKWKGSVGSFRIYKKKWYKEKEYYFYVEIKFSNDKCPFDVTFQQTIKDYKKRSKVSKFVDEKRIRIPEFSDNHYHVIGGNEFHSDYSFDTTEWEKQFVGEAVEKLYELLDDQEKAFKGFNEYVLSK